MSEYTERIGHLALFDGPGGPFRMTSGTVRALLPGEILVRNVYTTICGSDLHTFCGLRQEPCPTVLGHEIVGEIVQLHPEHPGTDLTGATLAGVTALPGPSFPAIRIQRMPAGACRRKGRGCTSTAM